MIERIIEIAKSAGVRILDIYYSNDFDKKTKADGSPLTKADTISNEIIINGLKEISEYPILTEESCAAFDERKKWNNFWLVDPLDGTKDFIAKNGEFTVNIALIKNASPVLGIIYAPALNTVYYAEKNNGVFLLQNKTKIKLQRKKCADYIMARSRFHDVPEAGQFAKLNSIHNSRAIGSALKFSALASGKINIYPRFTGSKEWDTAAGHIIIKESGCEIVDLTTMTEPVYNKPGIKNNYFIAFSKEIRFKNLRLPILK